MLTYIQCPYRFKLTYIVGLRDYDEVQPEGSPLRIGTEVHQIYEDFYKTDGALKPEKPYEEHFYKTLMEMENGHKYDVHMRNFAKFNAHLVERKGPEDYIPEGIELDIMDHELNLRGIIDRVDVEPDGTRTIIDYKTGKKPKALHHYLLELSIYKLLYERATGNKVAKAGIYFSAVNKLKVTELEDSDSLKGLDILARIRQLIKEKQFPKKSGYLCRWCEFYNICKTGQNVEDF